MEQWTPTNDTRLAAAMAALGVVCRVRTTLDAKAGAESTRFFLALASLDKAYATKPLKTDLLNGKLEERAPSHPLLNIYRGYSNWDAIGRLLAGHFMRLVSVPGTPSHQYVPGDTGLPGLTGQTDVVKTTDRNMAAALGVAGLPVIMIDGARDEEQYWLPRYTPGPRARALDAAKLMDQWRNARETVRMKEPFFQAIKGLDARSELLARIERDEPSILIKKPRSTMAALLLPGSTEAAFEAASNFLDD